MMKFLAAMTHFLAAVDTPEVTEAKAQVKKVVEQIQGIISWAAITGAAVVLAIIWVGYLFSDKDATQLAQAKKRSVGTGIAVAIVSFATMLTTAILSIVYP